MKPVVAFRLRSGENLLVITRTKTPISQKFLAVPQISCFKVSKAGWPTNDGRSVANSLSSQGYRYRFSRSCHIELIQSRPPTGEETELFYAIVMFQTISGIYLYEPFDADLSDILVQVLFADTDRQIRTNASVSGLWHRVQHISDFRRSLDGLIRMLRHFSPVNKMHNSMCPEFLHFS
jgi:hypothetical protein